MCVHITMTSVDEEDSSIQMWGKGGILTGNNHFVGLD